MTGVQTCALPIFVSIYLGEQLTDILDAIEHDADYTQAKAQRMETGVHVLPDFKKDTTDRNRTSPLAFTGNKFEFRMVGSSQSIASPSAVMNTMMAEELRQFADLLENADDFQSALQALLHDTFTAHQRIIFNGNGYSDEWVAEAKRRGLKNMSNTVDALPAYIDDKNVALFTRHGVLTRDEMEARYKIHLENYCKVMTIEGNTLLDMARRQILPAVSKYSDELATALFHKQNCGIPLSVKMEEATLRKLSDLSGKLYDTCEALDRAIAKAPAMDGGIKAACYYRDEVDARRQKASTLINQLETITNAQHWPFPTYADILFSV